ncbi:MAG: DUF2179 domain-containing protein [Bacteroidales bacterium]
METSFFNTGLFNYLLLPLLIFLARICDVSIGTMRIIYVSKGKKNIAPFLGFFEVLIWIFAISRIMQNLNNYLCYVGYASGFAAGNFVGMLIEERLAVGSQLIRVITASGGRELIRLLNSSGLGATLVEAHGARENVELIYTIVHRNDLNKALEILNKFNPRAFYTIEDIRSTNEGIFPPRKPNNVFPFTNILRKWRSGK